MGQYFVAIVPHMPHLADSAEAAALDLGGAGSLGSLGGLVITTDVPRTLALLVGVVGAAARHSVNIESSQLNLVRARLLLASVDAAVGTSLALRVGGVESRAADDSNLGPTAGLRVLHGVHSAEGASVSDTISGLEA